MARFFREDFDRDRSFVVSRPFVFGGQSYIPGQTIDKSLFTVRRLRQLYDMRSLEFFTPPTVPLVAAPHRNRKPSIPRYRSKVDNGVTT